MQQIFHCTWRVLTFVELVPALWKDVCTFCLCQLMTPTVNWWWERTFLSSEYRSNSYSWAGQLQQMTLVNTQLRGLFILACMFPALEIHKAYILEMRAPDLLLLIPCMFKPNCVLKPLPWSCATNRLMRLDSNLSSAGTRMYHLHI